jgi:hypothetical protein
VLGIAAKFEHRRIIERAATGRARARPTASSSGASPADTPGLTPADAQPALAHQRQQGNGGSTRDAGQEHTVFDRANGLLAQRRNKWC